MKLLNLPLMTASVAALTLASCSQDDPVSLTRGRAIDFRTAMDSRSTETTNANLSSINVAAFMGDQLFFPTMEFNKGGDGLFTSTTE